MESGLLVMFRFWVFTVAGWVNQRQNHVIDYLLEENRILRSKIKAKRIRFNDSERIGWPSGQNEWQEKVKTIRQHRFTVYDSEMVSGIDCPQVDI